MESFSHFYWLAVYSLREQMCLDNTLFSMKKLFSNHLNQQLIPEKEKNGKAKCSWVIHIVWVKNGSATREHLLIGRAVHF